MRSRRDFHSPPPRWGRIGWGCVRRVGVKNASGLRAQQCLPVGSPPTPPSLPFPHRGGRVPSGLPRSLVLGSLILTVAVGAQATEAPQYGIGRTPTSAEIAGWNIDVRADGAGLPSGHGAVSDGQTVYARKCAACHGDQGQGDPMDALVGGKGPLATAKPV